AIVDKLPQPNLALNVNKSIYTYYQDFIDTFKLPLDHPAGHRVNEETTYQPVTTQLFSYFLTKTEQMFNDSTHTFSYIKLYGNCVANTILRSCGIEAWNLVYKILNNVAHILMPSCTLDIVTERLVSDSADVESQRFTVTSNKSPLYRSAASYRSTSSSSSKIQLSFVIHLPLYELLVFYCMTVK
ncbi:unnamed protein product, partial [Soboliphyme baturini]|uniref:Plexin_cytopl domain-containing protein n=1 Tax=Soboliphyme baturini TaxID=241478 RepID=A0A183IQ99_9BILA